MGAREYVDADKPTIYFIGVTTGRSSIMKEWEALNLVQDMLDKGEDPQMILDACNQAMFDFTSSASGRKRPV